jgi:predicted GNAT family acetyltransferase
MTQAAAVVRDNEHDERYEVVLEDGRVAGFTQYGRRPGLIAFVHTEIDGRLEGQGLGGTLIRGALDDARAAGMAVLPFCEFVNGYVKRHPEYADLVPEAYRTEFDL